MLHIFALTYTLKLHVVKIDTNQMFNFWGQLTEGRKSVGGKLEVKIRIRDPFKSKQVEEVKEKWLVIDQFLRTINPMVSNVCVWWWWGGYLRG